MLPQSFWLTISIKMYLHNSYFISMLLSIFFLNRNLRMPRYIFYCTDRDDSIREWRGPKICDKATSTREEARDREERACGWRLEGSPGCVESETQGLVQSFVVYMHVYAWPLSALIRARSWFTISFDPGPWRRSAQQSWILGNVIKKKCP